MRINEIFGRRRKEPETKVYGLIQMIGKGHRGPEMLASMADKNDIPCERVK